MILQKLKKSSGMYKKCNFQNGLKFKGFLYSESCVLLSLKRCRKKFYFKYKMFDPCFN